MMKKSTCFVYWDPHPIHKSWAKSVDASFYSFVPFNSNFLKKHGLLMHMFAFIKALFFLPFRDVYLIESPMMITAVRLRTFFSNRKVVSINSDPFLWVLPNFSWLTKSVFKFSIKRIDGYISTSNMMDSLAKKTNKKHELVKLFINPNYLNVKSIPNSKNACFIGPHLNTKKGVDILANVFSKLPDQSKRKLFLIGTVGDDETNAAIRGKDNIVVTGRVPDPRIYLKNVGLYFNLARFEPAGINIIEAMATGIPPIVSVNCGFSNYVKKVSPKLVVPLSADKILEVANWLEKSKQKKELGKKAKNIAKTFSKKNSIKDFRKKFNKLLN